jgi:molecular chaperone DnaK
LAYGLGVDLGTTFTAAAVRFTDRVEVIQLGGRRAEVPSLVFVRGDGGILIGEAAERRAMAEPQRVAREFKRRVGDPVPLLVGGSPYSAHALIARLLTQVLDMVVRQQQDPPCAVTVTHPANWGPYKRELLAQAVRLAELPETTLLSEPEAAAIQYAADERIQPGEIVAVYDLGGGTFDAAVLRKTDTSFEVLGEPEGIEQLGGIDFDEAVFGHVTATLGTAVDGLDPADEAVTAALARLRRDCVEAKEALSYDTEAMIPVALPGLHTRVRLNRSEFEAMIAPALADTAAAMRRALRSAGVTPEQLRSILLAGGSSRIPLVAQVLTEQFGRPVVLDPHPEHSIAIGAALSARPGARPIGTPVGSAETVHSGGPRPRLTPEPTPAKSKPPKAGPPGTDPPKADPPETKPPTTSPPETSPPEAGPAAPPETAPPGTVSPALAETSPPEPVQTVRAAPPSAKYVGRATVSYGTPATGRAPIGEKPAPKADDQDGWLRSRRHELYADLVRESSQFATHLSSAAGRFDRVWDPNSELYLSRLRYFELLSRAAFLAGARLQAEIQRASDLARRVGHRPYQDAAAKHRHESDCVREAFAVARSIEDAVRVELG